MAFDWKGFLKGVAPVVGGLVDGPAGSLALRTVANALLGDKGAVNVTEASVAEALSKATPADLLKLKEADGAFAEQMKKLDIDFETVFAADRADARENNTHDKWTPRIIAGLVIVGFLATVGAVLGGAICSTTSVVTIGLIGTLIGYISAKADMVVSYYFGSSASSARKDETINTAMNK